MTTEVIPHMGPDVRVAGGHLALPLVGWRLCADFGHGASNWCFDPK